MNDDAKLLQRLFQSARSETPAAGAKARAIAALGSVATASAASATAAGGTIAAWKILAGALAAAALAGGVALTMHARGDRGGAHATIAPARDPVSAEDTAHPEPGPRRQHAGPASAPSRPIEPARTCADVSIADGEPRVCSTPGEPLLIELVNTCAQETVDLYWVDYRCKEVFQRQLAPGETHLQSTFATHPFRIRDHATHRLLKEIPVSGRTIAETDDSPLVARWKSRTHPHEFAITPADEAIERDATQCSEAGVPLEIELLNQRAQAVEVYWLDYDCAEIFYGRIEPGERWKRPTQDAHRWRVRDGSTHRLLKEIAINSDPAQRAYVTVP